MTPRNKGRHALQKKLQELIENASKNKKNYDKNLSQLLRQRPVNKTALSAWLYTLFRKITDPNAVWYISQNKTKEQACEEEDYPTITKKYKTTLQIAVDAGLITEARILLDFGADANGLSFNEVQHFDWIDEEEEPEIVRRAFKYYTSLSKTSDVKMQALLLEKGADPNIDALLGFDHGNKQGGAIPLMLSHPLTYPQALLMQEEKKEGIDTLLNGCNAKMQTPFDIYNQAIFQYLPQDVIDVVLSYATEIHSNIPTLRNRVLNNDLFGFHTQKEKLETELATYSAKFFVRYKNRAASLLDATQKAETKEEVGTLIKHQKDLFDDEEKGDRNAKCKHDQPLGLVDFLLGAKKDSFYQILAHHHAFFSKKPKQAPQKRPPYRVKTFTF